MQSQVNGLVNLENLEFGDSLDLLVNIINSITGPKNQTEHALV